MKLTALTGSIINSLGLEVAYGTASTPVNGSISLYIQNTSDAFYSKGTSYTTAILGMTNVYNGNMTISASTNTSAITFNLPTAFNYTGGGIYVAYSWSITSSPSNSGAYYNVNMSSGNMGAYVFSSLNNNASLSTLSPSNYRPVCRLNAVNTATNEAEMTSVIAPGMVPEAVHAPHIITADIKNKSINALTNVSVSLNVSGANSFTDSQVIASIAAGAIGTVTFMPFNPVNQGTNTLVVSIPADQNPANNSFAWTQSVTCNYASNMPPGGYYNNSLGFSSGGSGILCTVFNFNDTTNLQAVRILTSTDVNSSGHQVYGVLLDDSGNILATTNTITLGANNQIGGYQTFSFSPGQSLSANTDYYVGLAQPSGGYYPLGVLQAQNFDDNRFFSSSINGGGFAPSQNGYFGIDIILAGPHITVAQASTVICNGESITLAASGASSYTWSSSVFNPVDSPNNASIIVSPTSNEMYNLIAVDGGGCSGSASAPVRVVACTGIATNNAQDTNIRLFPNPSNGKCFVAGLEGTNTITVYNMLGEVVLTKTTSDATVAIDLGSQPEGNYLVRVIDGSSHAKTLKFVNQY